MLIESTPLHDVCLETVVNLGHELECQGPEVNQ